MYVRSHEGGTLCCRPVVDGSFAPCGAELFRFSLQRFSFAPDTPLSLFIFS